MDTYATYSKIKREINARLQEFKNLWLHGTNSDILTEFVFCLCTPQSNAHKCWAAAQELKDNVKNNLQVAQVLRKHGVRFHNAKSVRIEAAYFNWLTSTKAVIESLIALNGNNILATRDLLAQAINGFGLKEASHF